MWGASGGFVTIAVPTYNRVHCLSEALRSAQEQTYDDLEILVGDNASSDDTETLVRDAQKRDSRIRYFRNAQNLGMVANWNALLHQARGSLFLLLSDDDILDRDAISALALPFEDPRVALVYSRVYRIDAGGRPLAISRRGPLRESGVSFVTGSLEGRRDVWPAALMSRRSHITRAGGFPNIGAATDFAQRLAVAIQGEVVFIDRPLVRYRVHVGMESMNVQAVLESRMNFREWARQSSSPLRHFAAEIDTWLLRSTRTVLAAALLRRDSKAAVAAEDMLHHLAESRRSIRLLRLCYSNPLARAAWDVRRRLRERSVRRVAGQSQIPGP